jgi:hypothetical protein
VFPTNLPDGVEGKALTRERHHTQPVALTADFVAHRKTGQVSTRHHGPQLPLQVVQVNSSTIYFDHTRDPAQPNKVALAKITNKVIKLPAV